MIPHHLKHLVAIATVACSLSAQAAMIPITNAGFESPDGGPGGPQPDNWTLVQGSGYVWNINDFPQGFWDEPAPDGKQVLTVLGPPFTTPAVAGIFRQALGVTFDANTVYTLSGQTGAPLGNGQYIVSLLAGGTQVGATNGTAPDRVFGPFSFQVDTSVRPDIVGQAISIELWSNTRYTTFDALTLDAVVIPEPGALLLVTLGLAAGLMVPRNQVNHGFHG